MRDAPPGGGGQTAATAQPERAPAVERLKVYLGRWAVVLFPGVASALAVMPVLALGPLAFAIRKDFELTRSDIGVAFSGFFLGSAILARVGIWLARRFSTASVVRVGLLASSALSSGLALADSKATLVAGCLIAGAFNGVIAPSVNILIMNQVPDGSRGLAFGIKVSAVPAAASIAALGALSVTSFGIAWRILFVANGVVGCCAALAMRKRSNSDAAHSSPERRTRPEPNGSRRSLLLLGMGGLLGSTGTGVLAPFLTDGLISHGQSPREAASLLALGGWLGIVARILVGAIADRQPRPLAHLRAAAAMLVAGCVGMLGLAFATNEVELVAATLVAFGLGWSWPGLLHFAALTTHAATPARAAGYVQTGTFVGAVVGPLGFGLLAERGSFALAWTASAAVVLIGAVFLVAAVRGVARDLVESGALCVETPKKRMSRLL